MVPAQPETTRTDALAARDNPAWEVMRAPFPPEQVGKLPRTTCRDCGDRKNRTGTCERHPSKAKCETCGSWMTPAHIHLDYVGHADVTGRLLEADPGWSWTPAAREIDPGVLVAAIGTGNPDIVRMVLDACPPKFDRNGGLWIHLSVGGVTRPGYGDAAGKDGPNAVKECVGDAIRNAAMRFGVALDLWSKSDRHEATTASPPPPRDDEAATMLGEIGDYAAALNIDRKSVAEQFAAAHDGRHIRTGTVEELTPIRDDLEAKYRARPAEGEGDGGTT